MNQQEVSGSLADGCRYRATSYMVEITDATGTVIETVDVNDITSVTRRSLSIAIRRRGAKDLMLLAATLEDAGKLEQALNASREGAGRKTKGGGSLILKGCAL